MSATGDIIKRILALKPNLTWEAVERLIEEERAKAEGLLTEEAAAHLVASNLGLDSAGERIEAKLNIGDLTTGLNDVSFTARVIHVFPPHTFERRDGREGKVLRMLLGDHTGSVAVVFWDDKADHVVASKITSGISLDSNGSTAVSVLRSSSAIFSNAWSATDFCRSLMKADIMSLWL